MIIFNKSIMKLLIFFLLIVSESFGVHKNIIINDLSVTGKGANEPSIWINPENINEIMAGSNLKFWYYSTDAGESWTSHVLESSYGVWGDPCIITNANGEFIFSHLSNPPKDQHPDGSWIDRIVTQTFKRESSTFTDGVYLKKSGTKAQDKQWMVLCPKTDNIYMSWTEFDQYGSSNPEKRSRILFAKSTNGGDSWGSSTTLSKFEGDCIDSDMTTEGALPTVTPDGTIIVVWSFDSKLWMQRSSDEGETWFSEEREIHDHVGGWNYSVPGLGRCNGFPIVKADYFTGDDNGTVYLNWSDQTNGLDDTDIWFSKSGDKGETWSKKTRVNDDNSGNHQFLTWMDVDKTTGYIWFVFYDRREHLGNQTDVYMAVSKDKGESFQNFKVSESSFAPSEGHFFGDYNNISAHQSIIRPVWVRRESGVQYIMTAKVEPDSLNTSLDSPFAKLRAYPNPFHDKLFLEYENISHQRINLDIVNVQGIVVKNIFSGKYLKPMLYQFELITHFSDLSPGIYFLKLRNKSGILVYKLFYKD